MKRKDMIYKFNLINIMETKITKKFKELAEADLLIAKLYAKKPDLVESKFGYAYKRFAEMNYYQNRKMYYQEIEDARIENAFEDPTTKVVVIDKTDERGYKYTKDGLKKVMKKENEIEEKWNNTDIEIKPFFCKKEYLPELNEIQIEMLTGIII